MVLKSAEVHKYVLLQYCHNFLYMMHLWKIAYDVIIVFIEMLICYIGFEGKWEIIGVYALKSNLLTCHK